MERIIFVKSEIGITAAQIAGDEIRQQTYIFAGDDSLRKWAAENSEQGATLHPLLDTKKLRRRIEDRLRKGTETDLYRVAALLGVKVYDGSISPYGDRLIQE